MHGFPGIGGKWNGIFQFALLLPILYIHRNWFLNGVKTLLHGAPAMDTLVALGAGTGIVYSLYLLFTGHGGGHLYFEASGMILVLVSFGKFLEGKTKRHAADVISKLVRLTPDTATILQDNKESRVKVKDIRKGQIVVIRPGDQIPVDGIIIQGSGVLDESTVTGESVPVHREKDAFVRAGTLNTDGCFHFQASAVGEDTSLAKIIALIRETGTKKLRISRLADTVSGKFVPAVILLAILTFSVWLLLHAEFSFAMTAGIAVLLISCPCALGLATPLAVMAGSGRAAERSILFRSGEALETAGKITAIVFDKTGTLTTGHPTVAAILPADGITKEELLTLAVTLESGSRHPYAKAILNAGKTYPVTAAICTDFQVIPGRGIQARCNGKKAIGGNRDFLQAEQCCLPGEERSNSAETQLYFAWDGKYYGMIRLHDPLRDDTLATLKILKDRNIKPVMLTGDRAETAKVVAEQCGITEYKAGVLPEDKEAIIRTLQQQGEIVAMVGDGINDAPALLRADVGIAVCGGTDIAVDSADVILMQPGLLPAAETVMISRAVVRNIKINLFWAFAYNVLAIPLAAGVFYPLTGWLLPPAAGAAAMCASSLCVVINALRLRYIK